MTYRPLKIASIATVFALAVIAALAWQRLPPGSLLPTHWGADGRPDRYVSAGRALFAPVIGTAFIGVLFSVLPRIEPMQRNLEQSAALYRTAWGGILALLGFTQMAIAAPAFGVHIPDKWSLAAAGLLFLVIGNMLPKSRPGFFVGIRTPWTLTDPDNWIATHRLGAVTMIVAGMLLILAAFLPLKEQLALRITWLAVAVAVLPPIVYSWWFWRSHRAV
jgi:uncharacterized membrane protein